MLHLKVGTEITIITAAGLILEPSEILAVYAQFLDAGEHTSPNVLWDLSTATLTPLSSKAIRQLAADFIRVGHGRRRPGKSALVCGGDVDFGLARMLVTLVSEQGLPVEGHVFHDVNDAKAWLAGERPTGERPPATSA